MKLVGDLAHFYRHKKCGDTDYSYQFLVDSIRELIQRMTYERNATLIEAEQERQLRRVQNLSRITDAEDHVAAAADGQSSAQAKGNGGSTTGGGRGKAAATPKAGKVAAAAAEGKKPKGSPKGKGKGKDRKGENEPKTEQRKQFDAIRARTATEGDTVRPICLWHHTNGCKRGDGCEYSHSDTLALNAGEKNVVLKELQPFLRERSRSKSRPRKREACRQFQAGACPRGDECPYSHATSA